MRRFGLIGYPLSHSWSKSYWNTFFEEEGISNCIYDNFECANVQDIVDTLNRKDLEAVNVTIPYKEEIIDLLDELDPAAAAIGAVNFVDLREGKKIGYNFDHIGFSKSIRPFLESQHERCLILGTGGAAKAVSYALRELGVGVIFASRQPKSPAELSYDEINEHVLNACKMVVNTTPLGMFPNIDAMPPIPWDTLSNDHLVVDLIYNPDETMLLKKSKAEGATVLNGEDMLRFQAKEAMQFLGLL